MVVVVVVEVVVEVAVVAVVAVAVAVVVAVAVAVAVVVAVVVVVAAAVVVVGETGGRTAQKCTALRGHETKTTTLIWNYCLGSTAAAFLLLGIFFGLIFSFGSSSFSLGSCAATSANSPMSWTSRNHAFLTGVSLSSPF